MAECVLSFLRRLVSNRPVQSILVVPMHPFHGLRFELTFGLPRAEMFDDLGFEQSDDGFGQCFVVAVYDASDRHVASGFGEPFGVSDGQILQASVRVAGQSTPCRKVAGFRQALQQEQIFALLANFDILGLNRQINF